MKAKNIFTILCMCILLATITVGCGTDSASVKPDKMTAQKDSADLTSPARAGYMDYQMSIEEYSFKSFVHLSNANWDILTSPLIMFRIINGRYPTDMDELLRAGLMMIWPADIVTGKPFKIVDKIGPTQADSGKIAYVRESNDRAYFKVSAYDYAEDVYFVNEIPSADFANFLISKHGSDYDFTAYLVLVFSMFAQWLNNTVTHHGEATLNIEDALKGCFFWIEENMMQDRMTPTPGEPLFFEMGWAYLHGKPAIFYERTLDMLSVHGGYRTIRHVRYLDVSGGLDDKKVWDQITDKTYFYSTEKVLNRTLDMPSSVVISIADILEN